MWKDAEPRKEKKQATWTIEKLKEGGQFFGWLAGDVRWVWLHFLKQSKPCHYEITNEQLKCPYCPERPRVERRGYMPLYDESGKPVVVVLHEHIQPQVERIGFLQPVRVRRGKGKYDTVIVEPSTWTHKYDPGKSGRHVRADIREWLLTMWKDDVLTAFFTKQDQGTAEKKPAIVETQREASDRIYQAHSHPAHGGRLADEFNRMTAPLREPEPQSIGGVLPILNGKLLRQE